MKIAEINMYANYSTGKIMMGIAECARKESYTVHTYSAKTYVRGLKKQYPVIKDHTYFGSTFESMIHVYVGMLTGNNGFLSYFATRKLIGELKKFSPDIIHLHNIHAFCINLPLLFNFLKKNDIKVIWTLHDCWPFTGHCPHFVLASCDKWETGCHHCTQLSVYPRSYVDNTKSMWKRKKELFSGLNMTLVTPSEWLSNLVKKSFLKDYPVKVINNGLDLSVFMPTKSDFRTKCVIEDKKIILGVAVNWGKRKGLDVFIELSKKLSEDYAIVLVGTDDAIDKQLPQNIVSIHRTQNQKELAEIYTAADLFVNPTREDTYPTVNMEALACGTPVLTFRTGGSPEIIDETCGSVVDVDDVDAMYKEIIRICETHPYSEEACLERAKSFDMNERFKEYLTLYEDITHST